MKNCSRTQRLELGQRQSRLVVLDGAQAADRREPALVGAAARHADVEQAARPRIRAGRRWRCATSVRRSGACSELAMQRALSRLALRTRVGRIDADGGLQRGRAVDRQEHALGQASRSCRARRRGSRRSARETFSCSARNGLSAATGLRSSRTWSASVFTGAISGFASENSSYCSRSGCICASTRPPAPTSWRAPAAARRCGRARD